VREEEDRNRKLLWEYVKKIALAAGKRRGVHGVDIPLDCLAKVMARKNLPSWPLSAEADEKLKRSIDNHVRCRAYTLQHTEKMTVCLNDPIATGVGTARELASRKPGPLKSLEIKEMMHRLLFPLPDLETDRQILFVQRFLKKIPLFELAEELGIRADALRHRVQTLKERLKRLYDGEGFTAEEVAEFRNTLDRLEGGEEWENQ
jgi:hypothetical protein